jgi:hypothetical protein
MLDALVVLRERDTGDVRAVDLATARAGGTIARMLDFRLDPAQRILATRRTLAAHADGVPPAVIDAVAHAIEPGATVMALLLDDAGAPSFDEALARTGGAVVVDVPVSARGLAELAPQLVSALP